MFKANRIMPAVLAATVLVAAPACASRGALYRYPGNNRTVDDRAYRDGYQEGREEGEQDARRGRDFDYRRHDEYRDARRQEYRQGFVAGYDEGYRRYARGGYGAPNNRYPGTADRYPSYGAYGSPATQNGFRDGYAQGRDDARDGDRFDPVRASRYRSGDHDYNSRYGSRDAYKREYRAAFQQGYEQGYREIRRR